MTYNTHALPNGLRIIHRQHPSPVIYLGIAIAVGTRHERRGEYGLAHFTEHMLFKGTRLRSSTQIIQRLECVGGELNAYTSKEETILYALAPRAYAHRSLQLMADIVQHSQFAPDELSKEQTVVIDEINSYEDSPSDLIFDEFENLLFRHHPLGHFILGTSRSVASFTQRKEQRFFADHYRPDNMVLFAQGDINFADLVRSAEVLFDTKPIGKQRKAPSPHSWTPLIATTKVRRRDTHQSHVIIGGYAYSMYDKRRLALSVLVNLLGGPGMSARLNMALRERTGLAYHVECSYTAYSDTGMVAIYFGCAPENEHRAIQIVNEELERLVSTPLTDRELVLTKRQLKGQLSVAGDNHENTFLSLGKAYLHHGRVDTLEETYARIDAITSEELHAIACEIFPPEKLHKLIYH